MAETLKEYLIALGYQVDEDSYKRFELNLDRAQKTLTTLGKTFGIVVPGIAVAVDEISQGFEDLYYSAQRANATASGLQAMRFGFTQIGLAADQASASAEGLAAAMRNNPGIVALVGMLTGKNPAGRSNTDNFNDLVHSLAGMPTFQATQFEQMLHLDPTGMYQVIQNDAYRRQSEDEHNQRVHNAGVETDKLSKASVDLQRDLGSLGDAAKTAGAQFLDYFIDPIDKSVKALTALQDKITSYGTDPKTGQNSGALGAIETILTGVLGVQGAAALFKMGGALWSGGSAGVVAKAGLAPFLGTASKLLSGGNWLLANPLAWGIGTYFGNMGAAGQGENEYMAAHPELYSHAGGGVPSIEAAIRRSAAARGIDPDVAVAVALSEGLGKPYASSGKENDYGSSFGPFRFHYGGIAPGGNSVSGLGDEFTRATGLDARDPSTVQQQIDFALDRAQQGGWGPWHGWHGAPMAGIGGGSVTQTNEVNITVQGSGDPTTTANAVAAAQSRVNGDLLRNLKSAVSVGAPSAPAGLVAAMAH